MNKESTDKLLAQEYEILLKSHENIAARAVGVKAWSVSLGAGGLGLAYSSGRASILLLSAFAAFVFWLLEVLIRTHQKAYEDRIYVLENYFRNCKGRPPAPLQIFQAWDQSFAVHGRIKSLMQPARYATVMLPHVFILLAGLILFGSWEWDVRREACPQASPALVSHVR